MKYFSIIFLCTLLSCYAFGQNMVHNGGFEEYTICPDGQGQVDYCIGWSNLNLSSSDYFNSCSNNITIDVPVNFVGYQYPFQGNAYVGMYTWGHNSTREYVSGTLTPLIPRQQYEVTIHINKANWKGWPVASDGMGVFFYENWPGFSADSFSNLPVVPQIDYSTYGPIVDTLNWVTLVDTFVTDSSYSHIIIGNFKNDANTNIIGSGEGAYYYVDSVSVISLTPCKNTASFSIQPNKQLANNPIYFTPSLGSFTKFIWDFGDGSTSTEKMPIKYYNDSGQYHACLILSDANNCLDTVCRDLNVDAEKALAVPSAFTPNGDGENDILYARGYKLKELKLYIYNRWGKLIFETHSKEIGWDGTYKGQPQSEDTYSYTVEGTFTDGNIVKKSGNVSLIR